jgi:diguanylate cyclase (GGDEF)-like protein/hemerythrin-like metal-binding protein
LLHIVTYKERNLLYERGSKVTKEHGEVVAATSQTLEIFPWDDRFNIGLDDLDAQHKQLVHLLNRVAVFSASGYDKASIKAVFDDLVDYTHFHFNTEEALWLNRIETSESIIKQHIEAHQGFMDQVDQLRRYFLEAITIPAMDAVLQYLVQWLFKHILESDRRLAYTIQGLNSGLDQNKAFKWADQRIAETSHEIVDISLNAYSVLSRNTLQLMRELETNRERVREIEGLNQHNAHVMQLAIDFVSLPLEKMDAAIKAALGKIAGLFNADCASLFDYDYSQKTAHRNQVWYKSGISRSKGRTSWNLSALVDMVAAHRNGSAWIIRDATSWQERLTKQYLSHVDIKKLITVPLQGKNDCIGFVALETMSESASFGQEEMELLRLFAHLLSNVHERKYFESQLKKAAHFDSLTGLPNRVLLADRIRQSMVKADRHRNLLAIACLDLDNFKQINEQMGHETGDQVLKILADKLRVTLRDEDTLARLGGDEFIAVLPDLVDADDCLPALKRLIEVACEPILIDGQRVQVSASVGISLYPQADRSIDADQLLRQADQAMYQAKQSGKSQYHVFDSSYDQQLRDQHQKRKEIRTGIKESQFILYYQPRVNMQSGQVLGFEALIRWQHPEQGLLPPSAFLPFLDGHELTVELGDWVVRHALMQLSEWQREGLDLSVSINVDALHLEFPNFVSQLRGYLKEFAIDDPSRVEIEVLETSALDNVVQFQKIIAECHEMGIQFSLDDFGTGYSSLSYLKRIPVDILKIDQSFVRDMLDDPDDLAILEGVLGLSQAFHRDVVAEGVESEALGTMLLQLGCLQAQGYAIARPMPADDTVSWMKQWRTFPSWRITQPLPPGKLPILFGMVDLTAWFRSLNNENVDGRSKYSVRNYEHHFLPWLKKLVVYESPEDPVPARIREHHETFKGLIRELEDSRPMEPSADVADLEAQLEATYLALRQLMADAL